MKKIVKKIVELSCVLGLCMSLVACGSAHQNNEKVDETTKSSSENENEDDNKTNEECTISVWCWSPNEDCLQKGVEMYNNMGNNVKLDMTVMALADVRTKISTICNSGTYDELPDVILMQDSSIPMLLKSYPDAFKDLTSKIDSSKFDQSKIGWDSYDGKLYGIPFDSSVAIACYRTDYLRDAGYSIEDLTDISWSEFEKIGKDVLDKTGHPLLSTSADATLPTMMITSARGSYFNNDGSVNLKNNATVTEAITTYEKLVKEGIIKVVTNWDEYMSSLNSGSSAGTINGMWIMNSIKGAEDQSGKWGITNLPALDGIDGATNYTTNGGSSWMITSKCKDCETTIATLSTIMGGELSDDFYKEILLSSNYIAAYLPTAGNKEIYNIPDEFFNGESIYATIGQFVSKIPKTNTSSSYDETLDTFNTALTNILNGADIQSELDSAQESIEFINGN